MNVQRFLLAFVFILTATFLTPASLASADSQLPGSGNSSEIWTTTYLQDAYTNLHVPYTYIKISYPGTSQNRTIQIYDGVLCVANGYNNVPDSVYSSAPFNTASECNANSTLNRMNFDFCNAPTPSAANCTRHNTTYMSHMANTNLLINANSFVNEEERNISSTYLRVSYEGQDGIGPGSYRGSRNNSFRITASGGHVGFTGERGTTDYTAALQNRNKNRASSFEDTFRVRFGAPCSVGGGRVDLEWFDADGNGSGIPNDNNIRFRLINDSTGLVVPLYTSQSGGARADSGGYISGSAIGGNGSSAVRAWFTPGAGDNYTWEWTNVNRNNGVQLYSPYDGNNYDFSCPPQADASCSITAPATVAAGSTFSVTVRVNNLGSTSLHRNGPHEYALGSESPRNNSIWGRGRVPLPADIAPGASRNVTFTVTAPSTPGVAGMSWGVVHETIEWVGSPCSTNITIQNLAYNNEPARPSIDNPPSYLPGATFTVDANTRNIGNGSSPNYSQVLNISGARAGDVTRTGGNAISTSNISGLSSGASRELSYQFRIDANAQPGQVCFAHTVSPNAGNSAPGTTGLGTSDTSDQLCINIVRRSYTYVPAVPAASSAVADFYAGYNFSVTARTNNTTSGGGPIFGQDLVITGPGAPYVTRVSGDQLSETVPGLAGNSGRNQTYVFRIEENAPHGPVDGRFCLQNRINPSSGFGSPGDTTVITEEAISAPACYEIFNERFDISPFDEDSSLVIPPTLTPGQVFRDNVSVCNTQLNTVPGPGPLPGNSFDTTTVVEGRDGIIVISGTSSGVNIPDGPAGCLLFEYEARVDPGALLGDEVCIGARVNDNTGFSDGFDESGTVVSDDVCADIAEQAFIRVDNGSVWAGGGFDPASNGFGTPWCAVPGGAAAGYIQTARNSAGSFGAYADYIAGATDSIRNFGSGGAVAGTSLTFSNTPGEGNFNSGGDGRCITNLYTHLRKSGSGVTTYSGAPTTSGQFVRTGDLNLPSMTLARGQQVTIVVDGDVTLTGDVEFNYGTISDTSDISSFMLIVNGDITIDSSVRNLHGYYFATGDIDTCDFTGARLSSASCRNQLTVRGAFAANDIEFRRTFGGVNGANINGGTNPAELFEFNPEMYLADHILITDYEQNLGIDRIKDLPPVIN